MTEEDNEEYEEYYVHLEFGEQVNPEEVKNVEFFRLIGLETEQPILQLGSQLYEGKIDPVFGTNIYFEKENSPSQKDKIFSKKTKHTLKYKFATGKSIKFEKIFITSKDTNESETAPPTDFPETYAEALSKLKPEY